jgi:hypothetical protein
MHCASKRRIHLINHHHAAVKRAFSALGQHYMPANRAGRARADRHTGKEMMMRKIASALIALTVLAGTAMSAGAQTKEDEVRGDFWKEHEYRNPTP